MDEKNKTSYMCVKKKNLLKHGYKDLNEWLNEGGIYIGSNNASPGTFNSKFKTTFKVKIHGRRSAFQQYKNKLLANLDLLSELETLRGKTLGCMCDNEEDCHYSVIVDLLDNNDKFDIVTVTENKDEIEKSINKGFIKRIEETEKEASERKDLIIKISSFYPVEKSNLLADLLIKKKKYKCTYDELTESKISYVKQKLKNV